MAWFRRRAADRKPAEGTLRHRLVGLAIALGVVLVVLALRALPGTAPLVRALELKSLDLRFRLRAPIPEDPRVVNVDIDDASLRNLRLNFPLSRTEYGRVIGALRRLGAARIVVDVMFKDATATTMETLEGDRLELTAHDENLASAIAAAGNVTLAWSYESQRLPDGGPADLFDRLKAILAKDLSMDAAEAARRAEVDPAPVAASFEALKGRALKDRLVEAIRALPPGAGAPTPESVLKESVPGYDPERHAEETRRVRDALEEALSIAALDRHSAWPCPAEAAPPGDPIREIVPPLRAFNAGVVRDGKVLPGAAGSGYSNVSKDAEDGVLRRVLPLNVWGGRAYPYIAFRAACDALGVTREGIRVAPRRAIELRPPGGAAPVVIPLDAAGQLRVNWADCRGRNPFVHVPVGTLLMLDRANRDVGVNTLVAFDRVRGVAAFLAEKFPAALPARDLEVPAALQSLIEAEGKAAEAPRVDAWARMERHVALRGHADGLLERTRALQGKAGPLLAAARTQKKVTAEEADAAQAALDEAEAVVRDFVLPYRAREEGIVREFGAAIRGAVCIVGAGGTGHDTHATPVSTQLPGPWVVSNVVNMVLTNRFLREVPEGVNVAAIILAGLLVGLVVSIAGPVASAAATLVAAAAWAGLAFALFAGGRVIDATGPALAMALAYALVTAYRQLVEGRGKRQIRQIFGLFVNDQVLGELMRDPESIALGGQKRVVSVFFSDVAGFTALSEKLDPADQIRFMNDYLTAMSNVIMRNGGYINKYIGDGILALFGAPLESAAHAADAARAAAGCLEELARLNTSLAAAGKPAIRIRIGISTGEVVVGLVGALGKKLEYTVMGDVVNLGARLEAASKQYKTTILMSEACHARCREAIVAREVDLFRVPGKAVPVRAYELLGVAGGPAAVPEGFLAAYAAGLEAYKARRWEEAEGAFRGALALRPEDGPARIYVERCAAFRGKPPAADWDGVTDVTVK